MDQQPPESASDPEPSALDQQPEESTSDLEPPAVAGPPPEEPKARPPFRPPRPSAPATNRRLVGILLSILIPLLVIAFGGGAVAWNVLSKAPAPSVDAHPTMLPPASATATATPVLAPAPPPPVNGTPITTADGLQYIDIRVGTGAVVKVGDLISVQYTGWLQSTGAKFDSSYDDNQDGKPTQFTLVGPDQNGVIQGWVEGIPGMKVGGTRRLIIPPTLAYGAAGIPGQNQGDPPVIPPNARLWHTSGDAHFR